VEYIDPVRVLTNNSTGKMGMAVAAALLHAGADVTVVYGYGTAEVPDGARVERVETGADMLDVVLREIDTGEYSGMVAAAAVGDWMPKERARRKRATHGAESMTLELIPTPKIIDQVKSRASGLFLVAFRAVYDLPEQELLQNARERMDRARADMIVVNDVGGAGRGFGTDTNEVFILSKNHAEAAKVSLRSKRDVAEILVQHICRDVSSR
jgi:phosphopantothenoylcysteine decarboxylase/phosphopantothenate--cysteine ligase